MLPGIDYSQHDCADDLVAETGYEDVIFLFFSFLETQGPEPSLHPALAVEPRPAADFFSFVEVAADDYLDYCHHYHHDAGDGDKDDEPI